jgi:hypothetical protein
VLAGRLAAVRRVAAHPPDERVPRLDRIVRPIRQAGAHVDGEQLAKHVGLLAFVEHQAPAHQAGADGDDNGFPC